MYWLHKYLPRPRLLHFLLMLALQIVLGFLYPTQGPIIEWFVSDASGKPRKNSLFLADLAP